MAKTRVFISSTFYDLKYARGEIERFVRDMGFETVLNERGNIPYGSSENLEEYCYSEISKVNIVVSIIGGRFGSSSRINEIYSISNQELKTAQKLGKQVYIFVESGVHSEYQTYKQNKENKTIKYTHVDDVKIYNFLEEMYSLPINNQIFSFDNIQGVISYLREQWSGLFERFLENNSQSSLFDITEKLSSVVKSLSGLVDALAIGGVNQSSDPNELSKAIESMVIVNHPVFSIIKSKVDNPYRIFFSNIDELSQWIRAARRGTPVPNDEYHIEYIITLRGKKNLLKIRKDIFDQAGNLKPLDHSASEEEMVSIRSLEDTDDDDIPF